jgi:hypothetical protein
MIDFVTKVEIPVSGHKIGYNDRILLSGSCFAENIGLKMVESRFDAAVNPFGVLYNPMSVANSIRRLIDPRPYNADDLFFHNDLYHSFDHHSSYSRPFVEECLAGINNSLKNNAERLRKSTCLMITFGSAYIYYFKENGEIVANCHKRPESDFVREMISIERITEVWDMLIHELLDMNPSLKIIFTVSPIRHFRDGAHNNQLSKATLLLSTNILTELFPKNVSYFPAYELMIDELRDYRFYSDDMIHPSAAAINHIWERFCETSMNSETISEIDEVSKIVKSLNHRVLNENTEGHYKFLLQTLKKIERMKEKNQYICLAKDEKSLRENIDKLEKMR